MNFYSNDRMGINLDHVVYWRLSDTNGFLHLYTVRANSLNRDGDLIFHLPDDIKALLTLLGKKTEQ